MCDRIQCSSLNSSLLHPSIFRASLPTMPVHNMSINRAYSCLYLLNKNRNYCGGLCWMDGATLWSPAATNTTSRCEKELLNKTSPDPEKKYNILNLQDECPAILMNTITVIHQDQWVRREEPASLANFNNSQSQILKNQGQARGRRPALCSPR